MRTYIGRLLILFLAIFFTFCSSAWAHKVRIFAWQEGERILTESKFSGGRPAKNATIEVVNPQTGQTLLTGNTDQVGNFSFILPKNKQTEIKELDIIIDGGDGHKNHWLYTIEESTPQEKKEPATQAPLPLLSKSASQTEHDQPTKIVSVQNNLQMSISREELQQMLETTIDKKLSPIKRTLAENAEKGPSLQDILGGLGYIFGLAGIAAYMQAKKKDKEE